MRGFDIVKQALGEPSSPKASNGQSGYDLIRRTGQTNSAYRGSLQSHSTLTAAPDKVESTYNSVGEDWWNSFMNAIDEIDKSNYQGKRLPMDKEIQGYELRIIQLQEQVERREITKEQARFEAEKLQTQIARVQSSKEYRALNEKIAMQQADIESSPVSKVFQYEQSATELEENTNMYKYLKYELPKELGGSASEIGIQLATAYLPKIINSAAKGVLRGATASAVATGGSGGALAPAVPFIMAGLTAAEVGTGLYGLWKMRDAESDAEVHGAYEEMVQKKRQEAIEAKGGLALTRKEELEIELAAHEGLDEVRAQNMNLMLGDAMEVLVLSRFNVLGKFGKLGNMTRAGRIAKNIGATALTAISEGMEETDQYAIKQQYLAGKYKDDHTFWDNLKASGGHRKDSMDYVGSMVGLTDGTGEGYEDSAEYRNAFRSGAILGGLMGGAGSMTKIIQDERDFYRSTQDVAAFTQGQIEQEKAKYRADLFTKYFAQGKEDFLFRALEKLRFEHEDVDIAYDAAKELEKAQEAKKLYDEMKDIHQGNNLVTDMFRQQKNLSDGEINQLFHRAQHITSQIEDIKKEEDILTLDHTYAAAASDNLSPRQPLLNELVRKRAKLEAIRENLDQYYALEEKPSNIAAYEKTLEQAYQETLNAYNDLLSKTGVDEKSLTERFEAAATLKEVESNLLNRQVVREDMEDRLAKLKTPSGAMEFFVEDHNKKKATKEKGTSFNIAEATVEEYEAHEQQQLSRNRLRYKANKIEREAFERAIKNKLENEPLEDVLEEVLQAAPRIGRAAVTRLRKAIRQRQDQAEAEDREYERIRQELAGDPDATLEDFSQEEQEFMQRYAERDNRRFEAAVESFNKRRKEFAAELPEVNDNQVKRLIKEGFLKSVAFVKDNFKKNAEYSKIEDVKHALKKLRNLKAISEQRDLTAKEFEGLMGAIDKEITQLEHIENEVMKRLADREARNNRVPENQGILVMNQLGINADGEVVRGKEDLHNFIKATIGEGRWNAVMNGEGSSYAKAATLLQLFKDNLKDTETFRNLMAESKDAVARQLFAMPVFTKKRIEDRRKEMYRAYPGAVFHELINRIKDGLNGGFDTRKGTAVYEFLKEKDVLEFMSRVEEEDRQGSDLTKTELKRIINSHISYMALEELELNLAADTHVKETLTSELMNEENLAEQADRKTPTPSNQQLVSIRQLVRFLFIPSKGNNLFDNFAYLKGYAGTGKTNVVMRWVLNLSGLDRKEIYTAGHNADSAAVIARSLGKTEANTVEKLIADLPTLSHEITTLIVDEAPGVSTENIKALAVAVQQANKGRKQKLKVILLGDPNQITANGSYAAIDNPSLIAGSERMYHVSPLTVRYRSDVSGIVDVQDKFIDQSQDMTTEPMEVTSNTLSPSSWNGELLGVNGSSNFDNEVMQILENRKDDTSRSRAIVVNTAEEVQQYKDMLEARGITNVEVYTFVDVQGKTIDEVYVNVKFTKQFGSVKAFNTAMYTATSRATKYLYLGSVPVNQSLSDNIVENAAENAAQNEARSGKFIADREAELSTVEEHVEGATPAPKVQTVEPVEKTPEEKQEEEQLTPEEKTDHTDKDSVDNVEEVPEVVEEEPIPNGGYVPNNTRNPHRIKYPTGSNIQRTDKNGNVVKDGLKAGDSVVYVKVTKNGKPGIKMVSPVEGKPNTYREVGILSLDELNNPPKGMEKTYAMLKEKMENPTTPLENFRNSYDGSGELTATDVQPLYEAEIAHAQPLTYRYGQAKPMNMLETIATFIKGFFPLGNMVTPDKIEKNARIRVFNRKEIGKLIEDKKVPRGMTLHAGIPYLHLTNLDTVDRNYAAVGDQFIQLTPAVLNANTHATMTVKNSAGQYEQINLVKAVQDFMEAGEQLESILGQMGSDLIIGDPRLTKIITAHSQEKAVELLQAAGVSPQEVAIYGTALFDAMQTVHDMVYTWQVNKVEKGKEKKVTSDSVVKYVGAEDLFTGELKVHRVEKGIATLGEGTGLMQIPVEDLEVVSTKKRTTGPAQRAFNMIARANMEANDVPLRTYNDVERDGEIRMEGVGRKLLTDRTHTSARGNQQKDDYAMNAYLERYFHKYGQEFSGDYNTDPSYQALPDEERRRIWMAFHKHGMTLAEMQAAFQFDETGNSTSNDGFGLRVPLRLDHFGAEGTNVNEQDFILDTFEEVIQSSITIQETSARKEKDVVAVETAVVEEEENLLDFLDELDGLMLRQDLASAEELGNRISDPFHYLRKFFPNSLSKDEVTVITEAQMLRLTHGIKAWGYFKNGVINLLDNLDGTVFEKVIRHEAFHRIEDKHLTHEERQRLHATARRDNPALQYASEGEVSEWLATQFQNWRNQQGTFSIALVNFFKKILHYLNLYRANFDNLDSLFADIEAGLLDKVSSERLNDPRFLVKIREDYASTDHYRTAHKFLVQTMSKLMNATEIKGGKIQRIKVAEDGSNLAKATPMEMGEAMVALEGIVNRALVQLDAAIDKAEGDKLENLLFQKAYLTSLANERTRKELLKAVYPSLYVAQGEYAETLPETEEEFREYLLRTEGIREDTIEQDMINHEKKIMSSVKDFLATIISDRGRVVNPRFGYVKLLQTLYGLDTTKLDTMREQIVQRMGLTTNREVFAIREKLLELLDMADSTKPYADTKQPLRNDIGFEIEQGKVVRFTYEDMDGRTHSIQREDMTTALFFKVIKTETDKAGIGVSYGEIKGHFERAKAKDTLAAMITSIGSLREKDVMQMVRSSFKWEDGKKVYMTTYEYNSIREQGGRQTVRAMIEEGITDNYKKVTPTFIAKMKVAESKKGNEAEKIENIKEFLKLIGITHDLSIADAYDVHASLYDLVTKFKDVGTKKMEDRYDEETGEVIDRVEVEQDIQWLLENSNQRLERLTELMARDNNEVRPGTVTVADGTRRQRHLNSSHGVDVINSMTNAFMRDNMPDFLKTPFFQNNIFVKGISKVFRYVDHTFIKDKDNKYDPIGYSSETREEWFSRNINGYFLAMLKNAEGSRGLKYMQQFFTVSNKPSVSTAEISLLNDKKVRETIEAAILQEVHRPIIEGVKVYNRNTSYLRGLGEGSIEAIRNGDMSISEAVEDVYQSLEKLGRELTEKLVKERFPVDTELGTVFERAKAYVAPQFKDANVPNQRAFGERDEKGNRPYNVTVEQLQPMVDLFVKNYYMNGHMLNQLAIGDLAFYKNHADVIKRMSIFFAMGYKGFINKDGWMRETYRVAVAKDLRGYIKEDEWKAFQKLYGRGFDLTDGAAFVTPTFGKEVRKAFSSEMGLGAVMKPVHAEVDNLGVPRTLKYATFELSDEFLLNADGTVRFPSLWRLRELMEQQGVDQLAFESAFKVGAPLELTLHNETGEIAEINPNSIVEMNSRNFRIQLNPLHEADGKTKNPTQLTYFLNFNGANKAEADRVYELTAMLIKRGIAKVNKRVKAGESSFRKMLSETLGDTEQRTYEFLNAKDEKDKFLLSINFPTLVTKLVTQFSSLVSKATVEVKYPGSKLSLQPDYGVEISGKDRPIEAKSLRYLADKGYAEVIMPDLYKGQFEIGDILAYDMLAYRIPSTGLHSAIPIRVVAFYDSKGTNAVIAPRQIVATHGSDYDIDALFVIRRDFYRGEGQIGNLLFPNTFFGYDPNGNKIEVRKGDKVEKRFIDLLREEMLEVDRERSKASVAKDKVRYKELDSLYKKLDRALEPAIKNEILDIYLEAITAERNKDEMMTPITTDVYDARYPKGHEEADRYMKGTVLRMIEDVTGQRLDNALDLNNPINQQKIHADNHGGTMLVGDLANLMRGIAYMFQGVTEGAKPTMDEKRGIKINGKNHFTMELSDGKDLLSELLDSDINAALDNVKLQILPAINMTNVTGKAHVGFKAVGVPLHTTVKLMLTPAIKLMGEQRTVKKGYSLLKAQITTLLEEKVAAHNATLTEEQPKLEAGALIKANEMEVTDALLEELMVVESLEAMTMDQLLGQLVVMKQFYRANEIGQEIATAAKMTGILKALDVTQEELQDKMDLFKKHAVKENQMFQNVDLMKVPHIAEAYGALASLHNTLGHTFYKHHPKVVDLAKKVVNKSGIMLDRNMNKNLRLIRDELMRYLMSGLYPTRHEKPYTFEGTDYVAMGTDAWNQRFIDQVSAAKELEKAKPLDERNKFLMGVEITKVRGSSLKRLAYSLAGTMEPHDLIDYQESFKALHQGEGFSDLQMDFVKYGVLNFGLSFGQSNYSLILPPAIYKDFNDRMEQMLGRMLFDKTPSVLEERLDKLVENFTLELARQKVEFLASNANMVKDSDGKTAYGIDGESGEGTKVIYSMKYPKAEQGLTETDALQEETEKDIETEDHQLEGKEVGELSEHQDETQVSEVKVEKEKLPLFIKHFENAYVRLPETTSEEFIYYQKIGSKPISAHYQFEPELLFFRYHAHDVFRRDIPVEKVENTDTDILETPAKRSYKVGDTVGLTRKGTYDRMDLVDYTITAAEAVDKDGNPTAPETATGMVYSLANQRKVITFHMGDLSQEDFKDYYELC